MAPEASANAPASVRGDPRVRAGVAGVLVPAALYAVILLTGYDGKPYVRGDCPMYYYTAQSLYRDGDLDLANQLPCPIRAYEDYLSIAADGRFVPKHPIPMPVVSMPFVVGLGRPGALVFNCLQVLGLLVVLYALALRVARPEAAAIAVALTGIFSLLPHYVWNYSPDIFAALVLAGAWVMIPPGDGDRPSWRYPIAGLLFGFACWAKLSLLFFLPGAFLLCHRPTLPNAARLAAGMAASLALFAVHNWQVFGSPFTTSYDRIARIYHETWIPVTQRADFGAAPFRGMLEQMLDVRHGLLFTSGVTVLSWAGFWFLGRRHWRTVVFLLVGCAALYLFFSGYRHWSQSHHGNRFLMPMIALSAVPLAALVGAWRRDEGRGGRRIGTRIKGS